MADLIYIGSKTDFFDFDSFDEFMRGRKEVIPLNSDDGSPYGSLKSQTYFLGTGTEVIYEESPAYSPIPTTTVIFRNVKRIGEVERIILEAAN